MAGRIEARLKELGITLPEAPAAVANYVPYVVTGKLVFVSGQLPFVNGTLAAVGRLGDGVTPEQGAEAARLCALNLIAQAKAAAGGDLDRIARVVKLGGFVASTDGFTGQPSVVNGASTLVAEVFGERGRHARFAVGVNVLPLGAAVEVEGIFELA